MADDLTATRAGTHGPGAGAFPRAAWVRANAFGLALTFGLFALVGGTIEALGADHDSVTRNLPAILVMLAGGMTFAHWRRRVLRSAAPRWHPPVIGACLPAGFILGWAAPFDWIVAMLIAGTVAAALQLRALRPVTVRTVLTSAATWVSAGIAATAVLVVTMDVVLVGTLGIDFLESALHELSGVELPAAVAVFGLAFALLGLVGGAVGGVIEATSLRRR